MACNHSNVNVDTHNDGHAPLAVIISQGTGNVDTAHSKINDVFPFNDLPVELQNKIIGYAMVATDRRFNFPCLTNSGYTPNVTVGLLRANHRIYHEAHYQIRQKNTFVFGNLGSDLKTIASSVGPFKCRTGACGYSALQSVLAKVIFEVGDNQLPSYSDDLVHAFGCALRYLRSEIMIGYLHVSLKYHAFSNSAQLSGFASALTKIKVQDRFSIMGDEKYLEMGFGAIPRSLGMHMMPTYLHLQPYYPNLQYSPGWVLYQYVAEKHVGKGADPKHLNSLSALLSEAERTFSALLVG